MPQQAFPSDVPAQAPTSQLQTDLAGTYSEQSFPPFQPFPARSAPPENDNSVPSSRPRDAQSELSSSITHCGSPSMEPVKGVSIQASHQGTGGPEPMQRQHTPTLPAFTPFPAAAPSSRYAPPRGSRVQHTRPFLPPISSLDIEPSSNGFQYPVRSLDVVGSTSIAGYPRQSSPYAPPGPLTARPHVCQWCDSGFARAHDLKRHLETHKGERPHKCPHCGRSFSRKDAVQRHIVVTKCGVSPSE